ncbi:alpha-amylase family glycosyl hydrolase [Noviluteimonas gilva]|nr:alpha-amylase family glycosyl hydrolase [Lysobacter gilvus]
MAWAASPAEGPQHMPSPDWRDQILYFLMIDRFANGDRANDDQHAGEFDPTDGAKWSGGDLRGVRERIPYIKALGVTGVWITPPVANQWWNPRSHYGGYHGYWATDFSKVDAHFGTLADYQALARALHGEQMVLVQDIVVNHTADFFKYDALPDASDPARGLSFIRDTQGQGAPTQAPFDRNDPRDPAQRGQGQLQQAVYHWTPDIRDFADDTQRLTWQLAGLDDIDTESPEARRALRASYGQWIRDVGVDGFRVDTAFYVPPAYFLDFLHADDPEAPGIVRVAKETGRKEFHVFGEGFALDKPFDDTQARRIDAYMRMPDGTRVLPGMIDFPLYGTALDVFARGAPTAQLGDRIRRRMQVHADPWRMPTFVDNHDVDRFLAQGDETGLKQALMMMMTLPGIPVIWQGTEQGFTDMRGSMFAGGYRSGGRDHFDKAAPMYQYLQRLIAVRRGDKLFSRGTPTVLRENRVGPGPIVWRMQGEDGSIAIVAINTSNNSVLLDNLETGAPPDTTLSTVFAIDAGIPSIAVDDKGRATALLPPRAGVVWKSLGEWAKDEFRLRPPTIDALPQSIFTEDFYVSGTAVGAEPVRLVIDDDAIHGRVVRPKDGRWEAKIDTTRMIDPEVEHSVVVYESASKNASERRTFKVARPWKLDVFVDDPQGDDNGPNGRYTYPTDPGYATHPGDIEHVALSTSGGALKIVLRMRSISTAWNPPNGFDHVAFSIYIDLPKQKNGATVMPQQNAELPDDMQWDVRLRANGWTNAVFSAEGASATAEGKPIVPAARMRVDAKDRTITFILPATALLFAKELDNARVYVTTWDYDGGWRALAPQAGPHAFGGGDGARDARVLDVVGPLKIP